MRKRMNRMLWTVAGLLLLLVMFAMPAKGQFGADVALIMTTLQELNSTMQSSVGVPMSATANTSNQMNTFQQQTMYPLQQINQFRGLAQQFMSRMSLAQTMFGSPINSATLPATSLLEQQVTSGITANIGSISSAYSKVYGPLPSSTQLTPTARNALDMNDAQAQAGMKKAVQLDAIATQEFQLSQQLMQQLTNASPGAASMISAQAAAWNLQANAYTQSGMAQLLRVETADEALSGSRIKQTATQHSTIVNNLPH